MTFLARTLSSAGRALPRAGLVAMSLWVGAAAGKAQQPVPAPPVQPQPAQSQPVQRPPVDTAPPAALAFQGTTVIDVATGRRLPNQTIVVVGNRIRAVGPAGRTPLPAGTRVLRANGTFAIPGLWDMHVHVWGFPNTFFPLFIANGVTGVRDMGAPSLDSMLRWRREIQDGQRAGPRIVTAGPIVNSHLVAGRQEGGGTVIFADTPAEGIRIVDSLKRAGADFIKVYQHLKRDVYFAIAAEARRIGLPFGGHLPESISFFEASDSGQHSIEHTGTVRPCTDSVPDVRRCREIAARFRRNDTWVQFGLVSLDCIGCQLPWWREQQRYWPDSLYDMFAPGPGRPPLPPDVPEARSVSLEQWAAIHTRPPEVKVARDAGLQLMTGTDAAPFGFMRYFRPGFSLHDAMWNQAHAGLMPLDVLQMVTLNPAKYFRATDSMGTIAPGKMADLVFLDADPLVDVFNTRRIRAVVADGRFYDRADLDSLLAGAERLARRSRRP